MPNNKKIRNIISILFVIIFLKLKNIVHIVKRSSTNIIRSKYNASIDVGEIFSSTFR
jgi:hypothetical protein